MFCVLMAATPLLGHSGVQRLTDEALLDTVQKHTLHYFTEGAEPVSGMALERIHLDVPASPDIVTSGGSGFGMMALIAGMERGLVDREAAMEQITRMLDFLEHADRFHGVFPHWWNGKTSQVQPFTEKDNGGDLVETAFMAQALICLNRYWHGGTPEEQALAERADKLWREIEWNWYTQGEKVLYWHWSPDYGWAMNLPVRGYNECLIAYVLAAASPTYGVDAEVYHQGWAQGGDIVRPITGEGGFSLQLNHRHPNGGPLFWAHYSYLGLDPRGLSDRYADYFQENLHQTLMNRAYCIRNPHGYAGYGENCWGLTASYSVNGYSAHAPNENTDKGVIAPTAALSSIVYTPECSLDCMRYFYETLGDRLWGKYGFYDAFSLTEDWCPPHYLAIDQGPIAVMLENYRSGLLWELFMSHPDVQRGLRKLGFRSPHLPVQPDGTGCLHLRPDNVLAFDRVFIEQQEGVDNFGGWSSDVAGAVSGHMTWVLQTPDAAQYRVSSDMKAIGSAGVLNVEIGNRTYDFGYAPSATYSGQALGVVELEAGVSQLRLTRTATADGWQYANLRSLTLAPQWEATAQALGSVTQPNMYVSDGRLNVSGLPSCCRIALYGIDGCLIGQERADAGSKHIDLAGYHGVLIVQVACAAWQAPLVMRLWA